MRLKFHQRRKAKLKDLGKYRAIGNNKSTGDFYAFLTDKERVKYEKSALFVYKRTAPAEKLATDITGWEAAGFDKHDLSHYSAPRDERVPSKRPYPDPGRVVLENKSRQASVEWWRDPASNEMYSLMFFDGKLHIGNLPEEGEDLERWAAYKAERRAWLAGVRGPNDADS